MTRLLLLGLGLLVAGVCHAQLDRASLIGLGASVMKVEAIRAQGGYSIGSGVVVDAGKVVTNCHVTRDAVRIGVLRGGARFLATAQLRDVAHDLCLLRVDGLPATAVVLAEARALKPGHAVVALGYTGGGELLHSQGQVLALHRLDGSDVIQSSNGFNSGASGGGLFDAERRLVGILTFRLRGGEAHYFAAPSEWIRPLLAVTDAAQYVEVAPDRSRDVAYWQRPPAEQPRFLKAALLERNDRWAELESLASDWVRSDAGDPEPWYLMGLALAQLNRLPEAQHALECSLVLEPTSKATWAGLAPVYGRQGQTERATRIENALGAETVAPALAASNGTDRLAPCGSESVAPAVR